MAQAGFNVRIRKSGDSTVATAEACTSLGSNRYQITNTARRCLDPDVVFSFVHSGTTTITSTATTVNFEFGIVQFDATPGGAVTFNGAYFPLSTSSEDVAEGTKFDLSLNRDLYDATVFGNATRARISGLKDVTVGLDLISSPAAYSALFNSYTTGARVVLEIDLDGASGSGEVFRGFVQVDSVDLSASVDGLVESTVQFSVAARPDATGRFQPAYSWA